MRLSRIFCFFWQPKNSTWTGLFPFRWPQFGSVWDQCLNMALAPCVGLWLVWPEGKSDWSSITHKIRINLGLITFHPCRVTTLGATEQQCLVAEPRTAEVWAQNPAQPWCHGHVLALGSPGVKFFGAEPKDSELGLRGQRAELPWSLCCGHPKDQESLPQGQLGAELC